VGRWGLSFHPRPLLFSKLKPKVLNDPRWVLPAEMLHGLTFAAMWAATTNYAHEIAPGKTHPS